MDREEGTYIGMGEGVPERCGVGCGVGVGMVGCRVSGGAGPTVVMAESHSLGMGRQGRQHELAIRQRQRGDVSAYHP